jgi:formate dehydrogenase iron-sulfur subunit
MAQALGFFTDTTICIGCKACEVACKNWNQLPARMAASGSSPATATTIRSGSTASTGGT